MLQPGTERKTAGAVAPRGDLKVFRPENPYIALGLAVSHLMTKPAFANLQFGDWSRILTGQINRKHYYFAVDSKNQSQGFMGWALTSKEKAEAWVEGRGGAVLRGQPGRQLPDLQCMGGKHAAGRTAFWSRRRARSWRARTPVYFKRHYKDGSTRPVRLRVNDFVAQHIRKKQ